MERCSVVNVDLGNIGSIVNILQKIGVEVDVINNPEHLTEANRIVLPGVGAFDGAMEKLEKQNWIEYLNAFQQSGRPILGICLGMQLMLDYSEEGVGKGLGWIRGHAAAFRREKLPDDIRLPHMGWNLVAVVKDNDLFDTRETEERFYFLHSYHAVCEDEEDILTYTDYGYSFASSFQRENVIGVQFHPEKSHRFGMQLFKHFVEDFRP